MPFLKNFHFLLQFFRKNLINFAESKNFILSYSLPVCLILPPPGHPNETMLVASTLFPSDPLILIFEAFSLNSVVNSSKISA